MSKLGLLIVPNRKAVFVVDDDPGTLRGLKRLLREHGYDSVLFQSAEAFQNHGDFEQALCIILDINLNEASGIEVSLLGPSCAPPKSPSIERSTIARQGRLGHG